MKKELSHIERKEIYLKLNSYSLEYKLKLVERVIRENGYETLRFFNEYKDSFIGIIETLEEVFPENWDIQFRDTHLRHPSTQQTLSLLQGEIDFIIHFPEFVITNSKNYSHTITDLFIKLEGLPTNNTYTFYDFKGKRTSFTPEEINDNYSHSHQVSVRQSISTLIDYESNEYKVLNSGEPDYSDFCKGSSEINQVLAMLMTKFDRNTFKLFLYQLELYVAWESLEGVPYKKIANVIDKIELPIISDNDKRSFYRNLELDLQMREQDLDLDFKMAKNKVVVKDNEKLENQLLYKGREPGLYLNSYVTYKDSKGKYYTSGNTVSGALESLPPIEEIKELSKFHFRGKLVQFEIKDSKVSEQEEKLKVFYIHKSIKEYVKQRIEQKIEEKRFRAYITEKFNPTTHS